jgi:tRNA pseudouridine38-40 synthase
VPDVLHLKLTIAYDGTAFVGWQRQLTGVSIQGLLEDALTHLEPAGVAVAGAGRTDAGVHAVGQVASITLTRAISPAAVVRAVNRRLPFTVRVVSAEEVDADFHARFQAVSKTYRYRIWNGEVVSPFERPYVWQVPSPVLDTDTMANAVSRLEGTHDFAAFQCSGSEKREKTTRTLFGARVSVQTVRADARIITVDLHGNGFLRHMVRSIAGTLVEVGRGKRRPSWIDEVLASRDRSRGGPTAPASGLFLVAVAYE